jgi:hypothetical protein
MEKITLNFFDFDGTLIDTPLPETGKIEWSKKHGKPYPHVGWWGREESLCLDTFDIKPRTEVFNIYSANIGKALQYVLTARQPKLRQHIQRVLDKNGIPIHYIFCADGNLNKGEIIIKHLNTLSHWPDNGLKITTINFWDDRQKEIDAVESVRQLIEGMGIELNIYKVESDARD